MAIRTSTRCRSCCSSEHTTTSSMSGMHILARSDDRSGGAMFLVWRLVARGEGGNPKLKQFLRNSSLVDMWKKHGWPDRCRAKGEDDFECS